MRVLRLVLTALCAWVATTTTVSATSCSQSRVRKSWTQLTPNDKSLYLGAMQLAMKSREFFEFSKIHMERMSELQAHSTCAFFLWHKRFLLAFENMLRAQGPEYACVTVPYWDTMKDYAAMIDGKCDNVYTCSVIVREMGGSLESTRQTRTMSGETIEGPCYQSFAGDSYCDDTGACGCVPRGDLADLLPSSTDYASIFHQVAYSASFEEFSSSIQNGVHNEIHNALGGFMGTFASPIDPIFWSWHATVDMLLYVYHQCHVSSSMTSEEVRTSVYGFSQGGGCRYNNEAPTVSVTSQLIQQSESDGVLIVAAKNKLIGKYFADLPDSVADYVSYRADTTNGYTYEIPEAFNSKLLQSPELCRTYWSAWKDGSKTSAEVSPVVTVNATVPVAVNMSLPATLVPASDQTESTAPPTTLVAPASSSQAPLTSAPLRPTEIVTAVGSIVPATTPPLLLTVGNDAKVSAAETASSLSPSASSSAPSSTPPTVSANADSANFALLGSGMDSAIATVRPDPIDPIIAMPKKTEAPKLNAGSANPDSPLQPKVETVASSAPPANGTVVKEKPGAEATSATGTVAPSASVSSSGNQSLTTATVAANKTDSSATATSPVFLTGVGTPSGTDINGSSPQVATPTNGSGLASVAQTSTTITSPSTRAPVLFTVSPVLSDGAPVNDNGKYWGWYSISRRQLTTVFPGNITEIARQMEYTACLTFGSAFGLRSFSADFVKRFRLRDSRVHCQVKSEQVASGQSSVAIEAKAFSVEQVKIRPGVTPAPPVDPAVSFQQYQQRVVSLSTVAKTAPVAVSSASALASGWTTLTVVAVGLVVWRW